MIGQSFLMALAGEAEAPIRLKTEMTRSTAAASFFIVAGD